MTISRTSTIEIENTSHIDNSVKYISDTLYILENGVPIKFDRNKVKLIKLSILQKNSSE